MTRERKRRSDRHNRGIRDHRGELWEVELGRRRDAVAQQAEDGSEGQVIFSRKPDRLAFSVRIPPGRTLADYDDQALVEMIEEHLSGAERRAG